MHGQKRLEHPAVGRIAQVQKFMHDYVILKTLVPVAKIAGQGYGTQ